MYLVVSLSLLPSHAFPLLQRDFTWVCSSSDKTQTDPAAAWGSPQATVPWGTSPCSHLSPPRAPREHVLHNRARLPLVLWLQFPSVDLFRWFRVSSPTSPCLYVSGMVCPSLNTFLQKHLPAQPCPVVGWLESSLGQPQASPHHGHPADPAASPWAPARGAQRNTGLLQARGFPAL